MNRKPVVLLVFGEYPPYTAWGGAAYLAQHLAVQLQREGFEVEVIAESDTDEEFMHLDAAGNLVHRVTGSRSYLSKALQKAVPVLGRKLHFGNVAFAARVLEKTFELTQLWGREILWVETTNWRAETLFFHFVPWLNERTVVRIVTPYEEVVQQNGLDRGDLGVQVHLHTETLQQLLLKHRLYSNPDYAGYFKERVRTSLLGVSRAREHDFLLPFNFARIAPRTKRARAPSDNVFRLVMVGRIEHRKGFDLVCSALAGLTPEQRRRVRIQAVGRDVPMGPFGSYQKMLEERFPGIADTAFEWMGSVSDAELARIMANADGGLMASTSESFGFNLVELLAADLPVIAAEVGAARELERRGIRYLGLFKKAQELTQVLAELPERIATYESSAPRNRAVLQQLYTENDRAYLEFVRTQVAPTMPDATLERTRNARLRELPVRSVDIVCCSYNRFEELTISLPSLLREATAAREAGIQAQVIVVYQNEGMPERVYEMRPDWRDEPALRFVPSQPAGLTRARNVGVASSHGDLVIFVDDDVVLAPGFIMAHVRAAQDNPGAIGVAGRIRSRLDADRTTKERAVGQVRMSGFVEANFDSVERSAVLVPHTPMGANMSFKRAPTTALFGHAWFDERMAPSAFRDETLFCSELFRHGEHLVYAPDAVLYHFESAQGGCENRASMSMRKRVNHLSTEYLFLGVLYSPVTVLRNTAPWLLLRRDVEASATLRGKAKRMVLNAAAFMRGKKLLASERPARPASPEPAPAPDVRNVRAV
ncbi:glycosyltransferase [Corallococcus sp. M34]|uniref:glycosyltransferase n=1 Tax=Citreicoccus inhibens TaxID=2849499 RepID=UPI001C226C3B|nr:glycosyltransferase [Citreicoccus inhibens]MBU8894882.1 glycosyltransferase [Citreicoccus inhibens]